MDISRLTTFSTTAKANGRPEAISDSALFSRRTELLGIFEQHWALFAWELQQAKTLASLRAAFVPLPARELEGLEMFASAKTRPTTPEALRMLRKRCTALEGQWREATLRANEARHKQDLCLSAEAASPNDAQLVARITAECVQALKTQRILQRLYYYAVKVLRQQGYYLAQSEMLDFIGRRRYVPTPLSLANAMAGAPFIGWRASAARCSKQEANHPQGFQYELFKEVEHALGNTVMETAVLTVEHVRSYLLKQPKTSDAAKQLKDDFYYLRCAIESAHKNNTDSTMLSCKIFAGYQHRASARTAIDQLMEKEERLP